MSGLKKNFLYQTGYQILTTALPVITSPYLSRVLGSEGLGIYSYTSSIVNYFVLFAMMGLNNYGTRSIALVRNDREKLNNTFSEIYYLQIILSLISFISYYVFILYFMKSNLIIYVIQSILIINCSLDIGWFYFGMEKFKVTVTRNTVVKIITLILIFIFVKEENDLWKYILIMTLGVLLSEIILFKDLKNFVSFKLVRINKIISHFRPCLMLFIPILAMSVYHQMDKTMLGILSSYTETGYYYNADKIINIPMGIITGLGIVSLPRISAIISEKKIDEYKNIFFKSFNLIMFMCSAIAFGISSISSEFTICFFGVEYQACISLISMLSVVIYFKAWSTVARNQYLIPFKKDKIYLFSVIIGAIINFIVNFILIRDLGAKGAVIGTLVAEGLVSVIQLYYVKDIISIKRIIFSNIIYPIAGCIMFISVRIFSNIYIENLILKVILEIIIGANVFIGICIVYWEKNDDEVFLPLLKSYKDKIKRKVINL